MSLTDAAEMADDSKPKRSRGRRNNGGQHEPSEGGGDVEPARENADGGGRGRGRGGGGVNDNFVRINMRAGAFAGRGGCRGKANTQVCSAEVRSKK